MSKIATMSLTYYPGGWKSNPAPRGMTFYTVDKVTDSTEISPGDDLTKDEVTGYCADAHWKVTIQLKNK